MLFVDMRARLVREEAYAAATEALAGATPRDGSHCQVLGRH